MDTKTSDQVFEIISVYFVNCFWNELHKSASDIWMNDKFDTLADAYKAVVETYQKAFCMPGNDNKHYNQIIKNLYDSYKVYLNSNETQMGFIDTVSKYFLPRDYYQGLARQDPKKNTVFRQILTKS